MDQLDALTQSQTPTQGTRGDFARLWREPRFDRMECLNARFQRHVYAPHTHETYVIGVITAGTELYRYRGVTHAASAGDVVLLNPEELHDGRPAGEGYAYRIFYPPVALIGQTLADALDRPALPSFGDTVLKDPELFQAIRALHRDLERPERDALHLESVALRAFTAAALRHGDLNARPRPLGREPVAVRRAREYLDAHLEGPVELADLAEAVGLSRFHLLRVFRAAVGTTPHGYLTDRRVGRAKEMLGGPLPLAEIAAACGFCDQAHLNRVFKARVGVAPGHYRRGSGTPSVQTAAH
ncbi:AraC family transcriptional regulator [Azospirillum doebereinerae]|uniref:AraC family transcriptional regulator n=1 Tax=Azospirillum doebereinerae TaxID=92933 RepID=A0A3S0V4G5_9PROT|nr:AraC family transcriptional regulator [Azospirillum doebereinerae]MCG5239780.1 AraC family transcriptional regulator [Azospirillum doebereinerae]RUQ67168.1 AraC family transcriptional regulator [Azospirillum doebereinerae]